LIVVDTSALVAILTDEVGSAQLKHAIVSSEQSFISAPTLLELRQVIGGRKQRGGIALANALLVSTGTITLAWTPEMADLATEAFLKYGKGQGHPAQLNFGDCFSYALAKSLGAPLLFKGDDFSQTDIIPAMPASLPPASPAP
jgi:ribonuclease VapC